MNMAEETAKYWGDHTPEEEEERQKKRNEAGLRGAKKTEANRKWKTQQAELENQRIAQARRAQEREMAKVEKVEFYAKKESCVKTELASEGAGSRVARVRRADGTYEIKASNV